MATTKFGETSRYNQEISKYKLLSSTAGVGSIVNTKSGFNILIHEIDQWDFIRRTQEKIKFFETECRTSNVIERSRYFHSKFSSDPSWNQKVKFVHDLRFLAFLKSRYAYQQLELLVALVDLAVHEQYNSVMDPDVEDGYQNFDELLKLTIPATHFPKYFYNGNGELRHIADWATQNVATKDIRKFAPPFDIIKKGELEYKVPLKQVNLVLICPNGHLSEIPWSKFINYRRQGLRTTGPVDIFAIDDCCKSPDLKWTESTTKSEGFASVKVECKNCEREHNVPCSFSLEGITGLRVICRGHRPWILPCDDETIRDRRKRTQFKGELPISPCDTRDGMQVALATANNTYFANSTSSLFIPYDLVQDLDALTKEILSELDRKFDQRNQTQASEGEALLTKGEYCDRFITVEKLGKMTWPINLPTRFFEENLAKLQQSFLGKMADRESPNSDLTEEYRFQEYKVFHDIPYFSSVDVQDLEFTRVPLTSSLAGLFDVICQINSLKITSVQMNFSRVTPIPLPDPQQSVVPGQNIYSDLIDEVRCLPAVQSLGEGIFLSLDQGQIQQWINKFGNLFFDEGRQEIFRIKDHYQYQRDKIYSIRERYFLVHTLCHLLMKELEFTCGYPLASLKERLYISERMAAFMIMTSDGSEGSMGGLVSQASADKIESLVINALKRAELCSSDPLCWEGKGSGLASLNLASCFSCSIVSETACEERNLALDRRILLDREFGFFRNLY
jgi:hypothetical protein